MNLYLYEARLGRRVDVIFLSDMRGSHGCGNRHICTSMFLPFHIKSFRRRFGHILVGTTDFGRRKTLLVLTTEAESTCVLEISDSVRFVMLQRARKATLIVPV
jgi:hypothetical protein